MNKVDSVESPTLDRITYLAWAQNDQDRVGILKVVREHGRQVSQTWTGHTFKTAGEAAAFVVRYNLLPTRQRETVLADFAR